MLNASRSFLIVSCVLALASVGSQTALATPQITLEFDGVNTVAPPNSTHTGASGTVEWTLENSGSDILLKWDISNTTGEIPSFGDGATKAMLTGFGVNLPNGVTYVTGSFVAGNKLDTLILDANASPFGTLRIAAADNNNFNGGNANSALEEGASDQVSLKLTGLNLADMVQAFTTSFQPPVSLSAVMRFQQVNAGSGSEKLLFTGSSTPPQVVPEPTSIAMWGIFGIGVTASVRRRRGATTA